MSSVQTLSAARQQLIDSTPQLILLDIELPDGNGLDLLEDVKRLLPQPAVVVMTGHGAEYAEQAMIVAARTFSVSRSMRQDCA